MLKEVQNGLGQAAAGYLKSLSPQAYANAAEAFKAAAYDAADFSIKTTTMPRTCATREACNVKLKSAAEVFSQLLTQYGKAAPAATHASTVPSKSLQTAQWQQLRSSMHKFLQDYSGAFMEMGIILDKEQALPLSQDLHEMRKAFSKLLSPTQSLSREEHEMLMSAPVFLRMLRDYANDLKARSHPLLGPNTAVHLYDAAEEYVNNIKPLIDNLNIRQGAALAP